MPLTGDYSTRAKNLFRETTQSYSPAAQKAPTITIPNPPFDQNNILLTKGDLHFYLFCCIFAKQKEQKTVLFLEERGYAPASVVSFFAFKNKL